MSTAVTSRRVISARSPLCGPEHRPGRRRAICHGESERAIGGALSLPADGVVVATKGGYDDGRPQTLRAELEQSLRSLGTDRIDLYYLHRVDESVALEDSLGVIAEARERGEVAHVGISARSSRSPQSRIATASAIAATTT